MEEKINFAAVEFPDDINVAGRLFWYLCPDGEIKEGDCVAAPLGRHNRISKGVVRKLLLAYEYDAPYPLYLIKSVKKFREEINASDADNN